MKSINFRKSESNCYLLQLTSMVDMFTIILVFLLKSYSTSALQITPSKGLKLPNAQTQEKSQESVKVLVGKNEISVEKEIIYQFKNSQSFLTAANNPVVLKKLVHNLRNKKTALEESKKQQALKPSDKLILQIDKETSYRLVKRILASATAAGFSNYQLIALKD